MHNDDIGWLLKRRARLIPLRNILHTGDRAEIVEQYPTLHREGSVQGWSFLDHEESRIQLLSNLCPGWVYLGDVAIRQFWQAQIGHPQSGKHRSAIRVSNPGAASLLSLIVDTHVDLIGEWIERLSRGDHDLRLELRNRFQNDLDLPKD